MRIELFQRATNVVRIFRGIRAGSDGPVVGGAGTDISVGKINLLASGLGQRNTALVRNHANDLDPHGFGRLNTNKNALANWGLTWIGTTRQDLINHDLRVARLVVFFSEGAALEQ